MARAGAHRFDIQFLRGVAVLLVVAFHAAVDFAPHGFLGVDVFFVVSGFLVTGIVLRELEAGSFTFTGFYLRRARRLLPAAFSTFAATTALSFVLLTRDQWALYLDQLAGALTFTANIVLWMQADYFAPAAEFKPLLHIWSLSLEEQFYFAMPLALWLVAARWRMPLIGAGIAGSLGLCLYLGGSESAFYLLPARAWQLLAGAACAWLLMRFPSFRLPPVVPWLALAAILVVGLVGFDPVHPRIDAIAVVVATALILLAGDGWLGRGLVSDAVATVGDWSYSLYLVHWPLLVFAFVVFAGDPPVAVTLGLVGLSFVLAWLQFRFVEQPFRRGPRLWPRSAAGAFAAIAGLSVAGAATIAGSIGLSAATAAGPESRRGPATFGFAPRCAHQRPDQVGTCRSAPHAAIAIWGDSNAIHLVHGLRRGRPLVQITHTACVPALGVAQVTGRYNVEWARGCAAFNQSAFDHIVRDGNIRHVILASAFYELLRDNGQHQLVGDEVQPFSDAGRDALIRTIRAMQQAGKTVTVVAPLPRADFDPATCRERMAQDLLVAREDCDFERTEFNDSYVEVRDDLRGIARHLRITLIEPESVICDTDDCQTAFDGRTIYRNASHLNEVGSIMVVERLGLVG